MQLNTPVLFFLVSLVVIGFTSVATEDRVKFESKQQESLYLELIKELRCPKCQNQNIADSNAVVAKDMRAKTKELVEQGQDKQQVVNYMIDRYGQFAHYQPPLNIATVMLWLVPLAFVVVSVVFLLKRGKKTSQPAINTTAETANLDQELADLIADSNEQQENKSL